MRIIRARCVQVVFKKLSVNEDGPHEPAHLVGVLTMTVRFFRPFEVQSCATACLQAVPEFGAGMDWRADRHFRTACQQAVAQWLTTQRADDDAPGRRLLIQRCGRYCSAARELATRRLGVPSVDRNDRQTRLT